MKKILTLSLIIGVVALMSNCSPKTGKKVAQTNTKEKTRNDEPPAAGKVSATQNVTQIAQGDRTNDEQLALLSKMSDVRLGSGKQLYESTCNKCHELHNPASRTAVSWVEIMKTMGPKAEIEQGPYLMISGYLTKNAKG